MQNYFALSNPAKYSCIMVLDSGVGKTGH